MPVSVTQIKFNHDSLSATSDALNIRASASSFVEVPEWTRGETAARQSPAAYAIRAVGANTITVQARFATTAPGTATEVRALFIGSPKTPLGDLAPQPVVFQASGTSDFVTFR